MSTEIKTTFRISVSIIAILDTMISIRVLQIIAPGINLHGDNVEAYVLWIFNTCHLTLSLVAPSALLSSAYHRKPNKNACIRANFWLVFRCLCTIVNVFGLVSHEMWVELAIYSPIWLCSALVVFFFIRHLNRIIIQGIFDKVGTNKLAMVVLSGGMELANNDREKRLMQIFTVEQP